MFSIPNPSRLLIGLSALALASGASLAEDAPTVPSDLSDFRFINAFVVNDADNPLFGFHHFYVNDEGVEAFADGGPYPEGTVFLGMVYGLTEDGKMLNEGDGKAVALMQKVAGAEETGGWRFAMVGADGKAMSIDPAKDCFECHTQVEDRDYVFSQPLPVGDLSNLDADTD
jgi:hypothetical protein